MPFLDECRGEMSSLKRSTALSLRTMGETEGDNVIGEFTSPMTDCVLSGKYFTLECSPMAGRVLSGI